MAYSTPRTWVTSELVTAAYLNTELRDNLNAAFPLGVDAWTSYTPTLTQSATVTKTVTYAKYQRVGRLIVATVKLDVTGAGTAANQIIVGLPVAAAASAQAIGSGFVHDFTGTDFYYTGVAYTVSTTTVFFLATSTNGVLGQAVMTAALASGDQIGFSVTYEAAT